MANDPRARPTAQQLRELLTGVQLEAGRSAGPPSSFQGAPFIPPPRPYAGDNTPTVRAPIKQPRRKRLFGLFGVEDR
jgi:hypothetical protein